MAQFTRPSELKFRTSASSSLISPISAKVSFLSVLVICNLILNGVLLWHREDPEGLYYDAASDMTGNTKAKVLKVTVGGKNYVHIKFYTSYESETYAKVGCTLFLCRSSLMMPFHCVSSLPKIQYVLSAWLESLTTTI